MPHLFKRSGSNKWHISFRANGQELRLPTGTEDEAEAQRQLDSINSLAAAHAAKANLERVVEALTGQFLPRVTLVRQVDGWLAETRNSVSEATQAKYAKTTQRLVAHLKATESGPLLNEITQHTLQEFLNARLQTVSAATANLERKILRIFFKRATDTGVIKTNPIIHIEPFKGQRKKQKVTFTNQQMRDIYSAAPSDFWRYMILAGYYTGMRMGDLITLRIEEVNMQTHWITRETGKVEGRIVHVPIVPDLADILRQQILERAAGFIWPMEAAKYESHGPAQFSNAFTAILSRTGLIEKRTHESREIGRDAKRNRDGASFHLLRHTFVTELKNSGANSAVAMALVGHSSDAINELYTHMPTETLAKAVNQLPRLVKDSSEPPRITKGTP